MPNASPKQTTLLHPGQVFDRYTAERLLGHGGMGEVWLVRHNILQVHRALKLLLPDVAVKDSTQIERFLREAKLACRLKHPNLIEVHDAGYSELADASGRTVGVYYIFMDYVSGGSLGERLRAGHRPSLAELLSIMRQVASALEEKGYVFVSAQVEMVPQNYVTLTDDGDKKNMEKLIDMLEDNDDVQNVYHNWDQE